MSKYLNEILKLTNEGKTNSEICAILGCAPATVSYHLYKKVRDQAKITNAEFKKRAPYIKKMSAFHQRKSDFNRIGKFRPENGYKRDRAKHAFSTKQLLVKIGPNPSCYLTGVPIDLNNTSSYAFDHKIPVSQGGDNSLENLGICLKEINAAKSAKTPEQFIELCQKVLEYNGYEVKPKDGGLRD